MQSEMETNQAKKAVLLFVDEEHSEAGLVNSFSRLLLRCWRAIAVGAVIGVAAGVAFGVLAPKWYRAQTVIAPVVQETGGSLLGAIDGQLGGLASLAGLDLNEGESLKTEALARLSSRAFIYQFLADEALMPVLFADEWDTEANAWASSNAEKHPTREQGYKFFVENVFTVTEDRRNGLTVITIDWKDPELASRWANTLVSKINADIRAIVRAEAERNLEFLNKELTRTDIVELRQAINSLVENEIRTLMLVNVREQYAFKVIDPAFKPGREGIVKPRMVVVALVGLVAGAILGLLFFLIIARIRVSARADRID